MDMGDPKINSHIYIYIYIYIYELIDDLYSTCTREWTWSLRTYGAPFFFFFFFVVTKALTQTLLLS